MKIEATNWFELAESDYDASIYLFEGARYPQAIYLLCQAVEKILKAAQIELTNQPPKKNHQLTGLGGLSGLSFSKDQIQVLRALEREYQRVRYRDLAQASFNTRDKTEPIIEQGKALYQWIRTELQKL